MRATPAMMLMIAGDIREADRRSAAADRAVRDAAWRPPEAADADAAIERRTPDRRWRHVLRFRALAPKGNV